MMDRRGPYAPRRDYRDRDRERDRDRDLEYYDRAPPPSRPQWNDARERPISPQNTRRPSPPYTSAHQPGSPNRKEDYIRRPSQAAEPSYRDENIPTGPRAASGSFSRSSAIPTGPRSHYVQPPLKANTSYDGRAVAPPPVPPSRHEVELKAPRHSDRWSDDEDASIKASGLSAPAAFTSNDTSTWEEPAKAQAPPEVKEQEAPEVPAVPVKDRLGSLVGADFKGSSHPGPEAEALNTSTARLKSFNTMYTRPEFVALRKALAGLADSEMELAGAKTRTSITEAALAAAKEDAEAWSLESARIEIKEKNMKPQDWFSVQQQQQSIM